MSRQKSILGGSIFIMLSILLFGILVWKAFFLPDCRVSTSCPAHPAILDVDDGIYLPVAIVSLICGAYLIAHSKRPSQEDKGRGVR